LRKADESVIKKIEDDARTNIAKNCYKKVFVDKKETA